MGKSIILIYTFKLYDSCVQAVRARCVAQMGQERVTAVGAGRGTSVLSEDSPSHMQTEKEKQSREGKMRQCSQVGRVQEGCTVEG